jgi:hypothetical protein
MSLLNSHEPSSKHTCPLFSFRVTRRNGPEITEIEVVIGRTAVIIWLTLINLAWYLVTHFIFR